jgi:hypothetical protein
MEENMDQMTLLANTEVQNQGYLCSFFDLALAPVRYLFEGRSIQIVHSGLKTEVHHVRSYHPCGEKNRSLTKKELTSSGMHMLKTAVAILFLIPGFIIGFYGKLLLTCFSSQLTESHDIIIKDLANSYVQESVEQAGKMLAQAFFKALGGTDAEMEELDLGAPKQEGTGLDFLWQKKILNLRTIGAPNDPVLSQMQLQTKLSEAWTKKEKDTPGQPTDILMIFAKKDLIIGQDPGFVQFNPMKVILVGAKIGEKVFGNRLGDKNDKGQYVSAAPLKSFKTTLEESGKWQVKDVQGTGAAIQDTPDTRSWFPCKPWHLVYNVPGSDVTIKAKPPAKKDKKIHGLRG